MDRQQILAQLGAIRAICDALGSALAAELEAESAPAAGCAHPEDQREDMSTLRGPKRLFCRACKTIVTV